MALVGRGYRSLQAHTVLAARELGRGWAVGSAVELARRGSFGSLNLREPWTACAVQPDMRWSWIAVGFILIALLGIGSSRERPRHPPLPTVSVPLARPEVQRAVE